MIAHGGNIVAHGVHQLNVGFAGGHRADRLALNGIAVVDQNHVVAGVPVGVAHQGETGVAEARFDAAVHVAREQHDDVMLELRGRLLRNGRAAEQQRQGEENREKFLHGWIPPCHISVFIHYNIFPAFYNHI